MIIECPKHGLQHASYTCPLVHNLILNDKPLQEELFAVKLHVDVLEADAVFWSDKSFLESLNVPYRQQRHSILIAGLGEESSFDAFAQIVGTCAGCYEEFLQRNKLAHADEAFDITPVL